MAGPTGEPGFRDAGAPELRADCAGCRGLCCVAPAFAASAEFALSKPAGRPCPNLREDLRCGIHDRLRAEGFSGCTAFDCFGAGQQVSNVTFPGQDWRHSASLADRMFRAFAVMRHLHEMLWYLDDAIGRPAVAAVHADLVGQFEATKELTRGDAESVLTLDVDALRIGVNGLLLQASALVRGTGDGAGPDRRRCDLSGARLRGADLARGDLRGALLIGADLRDADLREADLIGADLRGADLRGADLRDALFLTQPQVNASQGNGRTALSGRVIRPSHWSSPSTGTRPGRGSRRAPRSSVDVTNEGARGQ
jgi:uncharacterized protein YjbI with pentapeptide repeats